MIRHLFSQCCFAIVALLSLPATVLANPAWPASPIHMVVPFPPGGSNDVIARRLADGLSKAFGQTVVVENKGGGAGTIGSQAVATSKPDGYTFLFISSSLATSAAVQQTPYDPPKAFMGVAQVARSPFVVLTSKEFPAKDIKELIAYAKANPRKMNFGSAGLGDSTQMATELFNDIFDIKMTAVPYKGISPAQLDLVAGRLDMIITTIASIKGNAADSLPKLAFTGAKREPYYPNIPTVIEATGTQYEVDVWWGLFAPAGIPVAILQKMNAAVNKIVNDAAFAEFLKTVGASPAIGTPESFQQLLVKDLERWRVIAKRAGVQN